VSHAAAIGAAIVLLAGAARLAPAQDFASAAPAGPAGALAMLERGLPAPGRGVGIEAGITRWFALPAIETRAVAMRASVGNARAALGVAQTGDPELGWNALGLAFGGASAAGGAALRALLRRDRSPVSPGPLGSGVGVELGGGAWVRAARDVLLWAAAPQTYLRGEAPPLRRGLELGGRARVADAIVWLALRAPPRGDGDAPEHEAGLTLELEPWSVWAGVRDQPLRAGLGCGARARGVAVAALVESHPILGETTRLSLSWSRR
jgi:hypothetical protein